MMNGYAKSPVKFLVFLTFKTRGVDGFFVFLVVLLVTFDWWHICSHLFLDKP